jgi:hypothetical protein
VKARSSFVSNSSSCSFCILGFATPEFKDSWYEKSKELGCDFATEGLPDNIACVFGKYIMKAYDDEVVQPEEIGITELVDKVSELRKSCGNDEPIKLYTGVMSC